MLHVISARCVARDLHMIAPSPLERTWWRQFATQWGECKKPRIAPLNAIIIIIIVYKDLCYVQLMLKDITKVSLKSPDHSLNLYKLNHTTAMMNNRLFWDLKKKWYSYWNYASPWFSFCALDLYCLFSTEGWKPEWFISKQPSFAVICFCVKASIQSSSDF